MELQKSEHSQVLSEICSVPSSESSSRRLSVKKRESRLISEILRSTSNSPKGRSILAIQRKMSRSPPKFLNTLAEKIQEKHILEQVSEEVIKKKRNKNMENYVQKQKKVFEREFRGFNDFQDQLERFENGPGEGFKRLRDCIRGENQKKSVTLASYEKKLLNLQANEAETKGKVDKLSDLYVKITAIRNNESLALEFLSELKENLSILADKTVLQLISEEQLENLFGNLKREVSLKQQAFEDLRRLSDLLEAQNGDFNEKLFPVRRKFEQIEMKTAQLGIDFVSDQLFQEDVLKRKREIAEGKQNELKETILDFADTRKKVVVARKRIAEQDNEIAELDKSLSAKKEEKINSRNLLNALDYIDRIAFLFVYNEPEEFDLQSALDLDKDPEKIEFTQAFIRLDRIGSNRSIKTTVSMSNLKEKRTFLNVINKIKRPSPHETVNSSLLSVFGNKRTVYTEKNNKKVGIERVERFYAKHGGNIPELFEKILNGYRKLLIEESSLKTRIEDLNEQKGRLFDDFHQLNQKLQGLFEEIPREERDYAISRLEEREKAQKDLEEEAGALGNRGCTLNELKAEVRSKDEFMKTLEVQDILLVQSKNLSGLLFLHESLFRFCGVLKAIFSLKAVQGSGFYEKEEDFMGFIERLSAKVSQFIEGCSEDSPLFSLSLRKRSRRTVPESSRIYDYSRVFRSAFPAFRDEANNCADVLSLDLMLRSFSTSSDFQSFIGDVQRDLAVLESDDVKREVFMEVFEGKLLLLKEKARGNCLRKYNELLEDFKEVISHVNAGIEQQRTDLLEMRKAENQAVLSSMEELAQEIDSKKAYTEESSPKNLPSEPDPREGLLERRLEVLRKTGLVNSITMNFSTDVSTPEGNFEDASYLEQLNTQVKMDLLRASQAHLLVKKIKLKPKKQAKQPEFMRELKKNQTEVKELLSGCVHNNQRFSRILSAIMVEERRRGIQTLKASIKDGRFFEKKEVSEREILRKMNFIRPIPGPYIKNNEEKSRPKTAGNKTLGINPIFAFGEQTAQKRPLTSFVKVKAKRSLSPRDLRLKPPKNIVILNGFVGSENRRSSSPTSLGSEPGKALEKSYCNPRKVMSKQGQGFIVKVIKPREGSI